MTAPYQTLDFTWVCSVWQRAARSVAPLVTYGRVEWRACQLFCQLSLYTVSSDNPFFNPATPWERVRIRTTDVPTLQQTGTTCVDISLTQRCTYARPWARLPRRAARRKKRKRDVIAGPALDDCLIWYADRTPTRAQRALFHAEVLRYAAALQAIADSHNTCEGV